MSRAMFGEGARYLHENQITVVKLFSLNLPVSFLRRNRETAGGHLNCLLTVLVGNFWGYMNHKVTRLVIDTRDAPAYM